MNEIWYAYTGLITPELVAGAIIWINSQLYSGSYTKLKFFLSSNGGDVDSSIRLYDFLKACPLDIEMFGFGQIDSAANIIFLAGEKRFAVKNCRFFLHEGTFTIGNPTSAIKAHEETLRVLKELLIRTSKIISSETGKDLTTVRNTLSQGKIFTTDEAKRFGIVHEIIEKLPKNSIKVNP